ncbi:SDR family NAD(P)-dependent oxidoreductase [Salipiger sp. PrR002]|uniref:SDR family NAD(P)-dependent oxidoreductase n=1 Tax=Salipiger sp. PrR002 TaxID=2706489 RepID=UPI0013BCD290|nr:SDR family oxidoreductase [Salipiger sp. PrR002]NDW01246.1 SDR family oxidoreductase [Salipiger sp. PrR002]NDW58110.1 SDR family oxidoreductase [Salipiger sp. PrR004]
MSAAGRVQFDFTGQNVVVTGASRGIGQGIAAAFAAAGASLWMLAEDDGIYSAADALGATPLRCDIRAPEAVAEALAPLGRIDVLVNNAGIERPTWLDDPAAGKVAAEVLSINVMGTEHVTRAALPKMGQGGRILLTSSIWGKTAVAGFSAYAASKHAMLGLMRSWAKELGPRGITVNAVCPGWIGTESALASAHEMARVEGRTQEAVMADILAAQAMPGLMLPQDIAALYLFLASDGAACISGQAVCIDRGETLA